MHPQGRPKMGYWLFLPPLVLVTARVVLAGAARLFILRCLLHTPRL